MEMFIKKGATLPHLELRLVNHSGIDETSFNKKLQNATATFSMEDVSSCIPRIKCRPMEVYEDCERCSDCTPVFYLIYNWRDRDTRKAGKYQGKVEIDFHDGCGKLIAPITEDLYIYIRE